MAHATWPWILFIAYLCRWCIKLAWRSAIVEANCKALIGNFIYHRYATKKYQWILPLCILERHHTPKHARLPRSVYVQRVKQSETWSGLGRYVCTKDRDRETVGTVKWSRLMELSHAYYILNFVVVYHSSVQIINWNLNNVKMYFSSNFGNHT